tara:strand:+ start:518 stop:715 length:198 start_codon:yes stop_codon:yes gene_type:complete
LKTKTEFEIQIDNLKTEIQKLESLKLKVELLESEIETRKAQFKKQIENRIKTEIENRNPKSSRSL